MSRSRKYCFTLNNYTDEEQKAILDVPSTYIILGREIGENQTPHIQGFIYFKNAKTFTAAKAALGSRCHIESCRGNIDQNIEYCSKDGDYTEVGERPMSNKRKGVCEKERWDKIKTQAKEGKLDDIEPKVFIAHYRTLKLIAKDYMPKASDLEDVCGLWLYGKAGAGKSRYARTIDPSYYSKLCNKWWDGYQGETTVLIDDIGKSHACLGHHLKIWSDRYAFIAETKGGAINIRPNNIVVTSQYTIEEIFLDDKATIDALNRRFRALQVIGWNEDQCQFI